MENAFNRRRFITAAGALLSLNRTIALSAANSAHSNDIKLGVASYSLRKLSRTQAIAALKELKTPYLNVKEFHLPYRSTPSELEAGRKEFESAGCERSTTSVTNSETGPTLGLRTCVSSSPIVRCIDQ